MRWRLNDGALRTVGIYVQACQPASASVHGDVLSHASNGHVEQSRDSPSSSFPSLDIATGFDVSYEPIMGAPLLYAFIANFCHTCIPSLHSALLSGHACISGQEQIGYHTSISLGALCILFCVCDSKV